MKFFSIVIGFLGILLLYLAFQSYSATNDFIDKATKVKGTIVDFNVKEEYNSEEEEYYDVFYPIIEFDKQDDNKTYEFESDYGENNSPSIAIGTEVSVLYISLPNNSFHAKWNTYGALRMAETVLALISIIPLLASIIMFVASNMNKKARKINRG